MDTRRLILAFALSAAIIFGWQYFFPPPKPPVRPTVEQTVADTQNGTSASLGVGADNPRAGATRDAVLAGTTRVAIDTPLLKGSIDLKGARLDDLTLVKFHETIDPTSPAIVLLSPAGAPHAYIAETGWVGAGTKLPDGDTVWTADSDKLAVGKPVTLTWDNGAGLVFTRKIAIDDNYMFTVEQGIANKGADAVTLRPYALSQRSGPPPVSGTWVSYEGPIGAFNGVEEDVKYTAIVDGQPVSRGSTGGWLGFSDKYWLAAVAPANQQEPIEATFRHSGTGDAQKYQVDYLGPELQVAAGGTASDTTLIFAGPKEVKLLAKYRDTLNLPRFDNAVDFGWFWFFTKPIFYVLDWVYGATGNFGVAILLLTVMMRVLFFPLQTRAVMSMNKMKALQPQMQALREKYADDKQRLNQETMELYKKGGANPLAGCLPIVVQIPVFFSLYKVLYVTIEMRHAPFFGWIHDLSSADPTRLWNAFGLLPYAPPAFLPAIGVWPLIYCASMLLQQRMQPKPPDPVQAQMMQWMPLIFTFMLGSFPAGLVIYWTWSNVLVICQQYVITRLFAPAPKAVAKS